MMNINRLAFLRMYKLPGNKQRKKGAANGSSLMFRTLTSFCETKLEGFKLAWKNELLIVVGYNLEVFTILWRAHWKDLVVEKVSVTSEGTLTRNVVS